MYQHTNRLQAHIETGSRILLSKRMHALFVLAGQLPKSESITSGVTETTNGNQTPLPESEASALF